jgi:nitric oxide reductase subunit C
MSTPPNRKLITMTLLILSFGIYSYRIYTGRAIGSNEVMSIKAIEGQQIWQKNNCISCHQFYGLGGYLGPDLTNVASDTNKGPSYIRAIVNSGIGAMPDFDFSESELDCIVEYLQAVDKTGIYPNRKAKFSRDGWVEIEYKEEKE